MNVEGEKKNLVDKRALIGEHTKETREVMPEDRYGLDEKYRKCSLDDCKFKVQKSLDDPEDKETQHDRGKKVVGWMDDDETSLMDLEISEIERTKRLEGLMERRRSRTQSKFQIIRNAMGVGVGNNSCGQISSLHIPKKNPFLFKHSSDLNSPLPGSAPTYMIKNNPFDLPYDPHEEKLILTGDSFEDEFMAACQKEPVFCRRESSSLGDSEPPESTNDKHERYFDTEFAIRQLRRLGTSKVANKEDGNKQPQVKRLIPIVVTGDNRPIEEGESSEKAVNVVDHTKEHGIDHTKEYEFDHTKEHEVDHSKEYKVDHTKEHEVDHSKEHKVDHTKEHKVDHDVVSSDQSTSSYSSSEDELILRPNKEAILHCLSMSWMRVISQGNSFHRNAESFDCGPSALFDKSKTDCFVFGSNKRIHYGSTNSFASDMQVEVSELSSPRSTIMSSIDEEGKGSLVNSTNPSEMDLNEVRLRDIDELIEQDTTEHGFSQRALDPDCFGSTKKPEKSNEQDAHCLTEEDR